MRILEPYAAGRFSETIPLHKRAIAIAEKALGRDHPTTIKRVEDCGHMLSITGHIEEAKGYYERASRRRAGDREQEEGFGRRLRLARQSLYVGRSSTRSPRRSTSKCSRCREKLVGPNDAAVARTIDELAMVYNRQGASARKRSCAVAP